VGVDIVPQPNYPFNFITGDALEWMRDGHWKHYQAIQAIHASPPCQAYSWSARRWTEVERADLVEPTRELLQATGLPYVIENVVGAPLREPLTLCGTQFGLEVLRHRLFESNVMLLGPGTKCRHTGSVKTGEYVTVAGHGGDNIKGRGSRAVKQRAMGIDWMTDAELNESIPPAYTEWIGTQLMAAIAVAA